MIEDYDGQGKSQEDEVLGSMRVVAVVLLLSGAVMVGGVVVLVRALWG